VNKKALLLILLLAGCSTPTEPQIVPPEPILVAASTQLDPVDHRIYADVDPNINAIWIEWNRDSTRTTTGYLLRRSIDSTVGADGILSDSVRLIAKLETTDQTIEPLPTSYRDTASIFPGATYFYQLQAYHRSPTGKLTYSQPTHVDLSTSFHYTHPVLPLYPSGQESIQATGLKFSWHDPEDGGTFHIIVERLDTPMYVWSEKKPNFSNEPVETYPDTAQPLVSNAQYRWRVKRIIPNGGSSSRWTSFSILP
jgi:hypothetical protein